MGIDTELPSGWRRRAAAVLVFWLLAVGPLGFFALKLPAETTMQFTAPSGSDGRLADEALAAYFPNAEASAHLAVLVRAKDGTNICDSAAAAAFSKYFNQSVSDWAQPRVGDLGTVAIQGRFLPPIGCVPGAQPGDQPMACNLLGAGLVSKSNTSTILIITTERGVTDSQGNQATFDLVDYARKVIDEDTRLPRNAYDVLLTGDQAINLDGQRGTIGDIERMEMICLPFALAVLFCFLRSVRLMIIPVAAVGCTVVLAFAAMYPCAKQIKVIQVTPSIMLSLSLALSIDYSLFLLMRFREGIERDLPLVECLRSLRHTVHTITVSGSLIAVAMFGLVLVPCEPVRATGVGAGLSVAAAVIVSLSLTPALLTCFGSFFSNLEMWGLQGPCCKEPAERKCGLSVQCIFAQSKVEEEGEDAGLVNEAACEEQQLRTAQNSSVWFRVALLTKRAPIPVVLAVLAFGAPFYARVGSLDFSTLDGLELVPRSAPSVHAFRAFEEDFLPGLISPYRVVLIDKAAPPPPPGYDGVNLTESHLYSPEGFSAIGRLARAIIDAPLPSYIPPMTNDSLTAVVFIPADFGDGTGYRSHYVDFEAARDLADLPAYRSLLKGMLSQPDHGAAQITVALTVRPMGNGASDWISAARAAAAKFVEAEGGRYEVHVGAGISTLKDFSGKVTDSLPTMLGTIIACVTVLVAAFFRSVAVPIRLALALLYTVSVTFGVAFYFYQTEFGEWVMPFMSDFKGDAIQWLVPSLSITVTVALGLDYDIFLLTRVVELRRDGPFTDEASILKGVYHTGWIISGAGVIMAIAFFGLVMSEVVVLNQFGVILCVSVLLDTFVIRTVLLPALMFVLGEWNWWPRKFPEPRYGTDDFPGCERVAPPDVPSPKSADSFL